VQSPAVAGFGKPNHPVDILMAKAKKKTQRLKHLGRIADELQKCARCGECRSVCPVFDALQWEKYAARGKVALTRALLSGQLELSPAYAEVVENCLLCLACVENCGSGVRLDRIIMEARNELVRARGLPFVKKMVHRLLQSGREWKDFLARRGSVAQFLLFRRLPGSSGLRRRFPMPLVQKDRYIPALVRRSFRSMMPEINRVEAARQKVIFFTGCLINYVYPQIGGSVVRVLNRFHTEVMIPRAQNCCGAPAEVDGDLGSARVLARKNLDTLCAYPHDIVTACASGGYMLKKIYPDILDRDDPHYRKALSVAGRTYDISEYLVKKIGLPEIEKNVRPGSSQKVTYHDPCHLVRGQGVADEPRRLLQAAFGAQFVEMREADRCCGSGGTYGLTHRDASLHILHRKTARISATGADIVATGCPGCVIQLKDGLIGEASGTRVCHVIELIDRALCDPHA
jgi:glycolate oxidase iron-sulfur subunit